MKWLRSLVAAALLAGFVGAQTSAQTAGPPTFAPTSCPFKVGSGLKVGKQVTCGYLAVPEDRLAHPTSTIKLAIAIFKSPAANPAPDPVVFLQGGPGGGILNLLGPAINARDLSVFTGRHDLILIDQRGTGYSRPSLTCPNLIRLKYRYLAKNLSDARQNALQLAAVRVCREHLVKHGIRLDAFNTYEDAADVAALRQTLGYQQMDLYGVSYGTRLALEIMRDFPSGIGSVVLDSVVPPQSNGFSSDGLAIAHDFGVLFAGCAKARACNHRYPRLKRVFDGTVKALNRKPVTISVEDPANRKHYRIFFNGEALVSVIFQSLYDTTLIPSLPQAIAATAQHHFGAIAKLAGATSFDDNLISMGTYLSMKCSDSTPYPSETQIESAVTSIPAPLRAPIRAELVGEAQQCRAWAVPPAPSAERQQLVSAIPTLVLSGEYDPITPAANGRRVAQTLQHSYFFEFPGTGHAVFLTSPCVYRITESFLDSPRQRPDGSCAARMSEPFK